MHRATVRSLLSRAAAAALIVVIALPSFAASAVRGPGDVVPPDVDLCARPSASCADPQLGLSTGVAFHVWSYDTHADMERALDMMARAGIRWVRIDMSWRTLFPQPDHVNSRFAGDLDFALSRATQDGMRVLAVLLDTPEWAARDGSSGASPPRNPALFGDYARWIAANLGDRVDAYEIWNEPDSTGFFTGNVDDYAALLEAAYGQIKQWDLVGNTVVLGGLTYNDTDWLERLYSVGSDIPLYFDVVAVHPYQSPSDMPPECPPTTMWRLSSVAWIRRVMVDHGDSETPIWITEFGWSSHPNLPGFPNWQLGVDEERQADYAVRALRFIASDLPYVQKAFWYDASDSAIDYPAVALRVHENSFGLLRRDLSPKPVYDAIARYLSDGTMPATAGGSCN